MGVVQHRCSAGRGSERCRREWWSAGTALRLTSSFTGSFFFRELFVYGVLVPQEVMEKCALRRASRRYVPSFIILNTVKYFAVTANKIKERNKEETCSSWVKSALVQNQQGEQLTAVPLPTRPDAAPAHMHSYLTSPKKLSMLKTVVLLKKV